MVVILHWIGSLLHSTCLLCWERGCTRGSLAYRNMLVGYRVRITAHATLGYKVHERIFNIAWRLEWEKIVSLYGITMMSLTGIQ